MKQSADLLRDRVKHYLFVSSISVYKDLNEINLDETSAVGTVEDETIEDITGDTFGPLKALCEQVQFIDVRDLAEFMIHGLENKTMGLMNAVSPSGEMSMGELVRTCRKVSGSNATFTWVPGDFLAKHDVHAWSDMPCWIPINEEAGIGTIQVKRALKAGITFRPVRDTLDWWDTIPSERANKPMRSGLTPEREIEVLTAYHELG